MTDVSHLAELHSLQALAFHNVGEVTLLMNNAGVGQNPGKQARSSR